MLKLRKLIKEHTWDREFGDPLVTFEDVMKKHQVNKFKEDLDSVGKEDDDVDNDGDSDASDDYLKNRRDVISKAIEKESVTEGWWDNMSPSAQKSYIKKHGEAPNSSGKKEDDAESKIDKAISKDKKGRAKKKELNRKWDATRGSARTGKELGENKMKLESLLKVINCIKQIYIIIKKIDNDNYLKDLKNNNLIPYIVVYLDDCSNNKISKKYLMLNQSLLLC